MSSTSKNLINESITLIVVALADDQYRITVGDQEPYIVNGPGYAKGAIKRAFTQNGDEWSEADLELPVYDPQWDMAGTDGTHEYFVLAYSDRGRVGVRVLGKNVRVRVEPSPDTPKSDAQFVGTFPSHIWKRPNGQRRYSRYGIREAILHPSIVSAITGLQGAGAFTLNPDLGESEFQSVWDRALDASDADDSSSAPESEDASQEYQEGDSSDWDGEQSPEQQKAKILEASMQELRKTFASDEEYEAFQQSPAFGLYNSVVETVADRVSRPEAGESPTLEDRETFLSALIGPVEEMMRADGATDEDIEAFLGYVDERRSFIVDGTCPHEPTTDNVEELRHLLHIANHDVEALERHIEQGELIMEGLLAQSMDDALSINELTRRAYEESARADRCEADHASLQHTAASRMAEIEELRATVSSLRERVRWFEGQYADVAFAQRADLVEKG